MQLPLFWGQEGKEALKSSLRLAEFSFWISFLCPVLSSRRQCWCGGNFLPPMRIHHSLLVYVVLIAHSHGQDGKERREKCFYTSSVEMLISSFIFFFFFPSADGTLNSVFSLERFPNVSS